MSALKFDCGRGTVLRFSLAEGGGGVAQSHATRPNHCYSLYLPAHQLRARLRVCAAAAAAAVLVLALFGIHPPLLLLVLAPALGVDAAVRRPAL